MPLSRMRPTAPPWLFLVEAQKGRKPGLRVEPDILISAGAALYGPQKINRSYAKERTNIMGLFHSNFDKPGRV